jgi:hypothetical protein
MTNPVERDGHAALSHERLLDAGQRLDALRSHAERLPAEQRHELERTLDRLRGQRNRALARLEDCRLASGDAWPSVRDQATAALNDLLVGIAEMERRTTRRVAA